MRRAPRAFTLIEVIVTIVIVAVLSAIAVGTYAAVANRAQQSAVRENVSTVVSAVGTQAIVNDTDLTRAAVTEALADITGQTVSDADGQGAIKLGTANSPVDKVDQYAVGFTDSAGVVSNVRGVRVVLLASTPEDGVNAHLLSLGQCRRPGMSTQPGSPAAGDRCLRSGVVPRGTSPADVLANPDLIRAPTFD